MKYTQALRNEIVKAIDFEGYTKFDGSPFAPQTDADKISLLINVAMDEVGHEFKAKGMQGGLEYCYLASLPASTCPFTIARLSNSLTKSGQSAKMYQRSMRKKSSLTSTVLWPPISCNGTIRF